MDWRRQRTTVRAVPLLLAMGLLAVLAQPACKRKTPGVDYGCLQFELLYGRAQHPGNVLLFFKLETCDGRPVSDLQDDHLLLKEDDRTLSRTESGQTLLPPSMGYDWFTVLLLDMSGSIIDSGALSDLQEAARQFVDRAVSGRRMAIYLFDGRAVIEQLVPFTADPAALRDGINSLSSYTPVDPSTNLNGAVVSGLDLLDTEASRSPAALAYGTLVVLTDGVDLAGRVTDQEAVDAVQLTEHAVYTVGLGDAVDPAHLAAVGKDGAELAPTSADLTAAFQRVADSADQETQKYYLLAYCTPKRAGFHTATLEVSGGDGSLSFDFSADGFEPGCNALEIATACDNRECGMVEGILTCGTCVAGEYCSPAGLCIDPLACGNGEIDSGEQCDTDNLGGATCQSLDFPGGDLACTNICTYDTSGCDPPVTCGDGAIQAPETCDGTNLGGHTCESLGYASGVLDCLQNCTWDLTRCVPHQPPAITGIDGTADALPIAPRPEDQAAYDNTPNKIDASRRIDGNTRQLAITGANLENPLTVSAVGQTGQGTIDFEILPGGTDTMLTVRFPQVMTVTAGGLFLLTLLTPHGQAQAQVFFLQGQDGQDGVCSNTVTGDLTVTGNVNIAGDLAVQGSYDLGDCPAGYDRDPAADPSIIVCVHPVSNDEMVKVGDFWVDRYEATVFDNADCTGTPLGNTADDWAARAPDFPHNGNWTTKYYACSVPGVTPSRWLTWFMMQAACAARGKHLCTNTEWQVAAEGTFDPGSYDGIGGGACHTNGSGPRQIGMAGTEPGGMTSCISRWGSEDMVGNMWEWTADWVPAGLHGWQTNDGQESTVAWPATYGGDSTWNVTGRSHNGTAWTDGLPSAPNRGGSWQYGSRGGVFAFSLNDGPSRSANSISFRCCRTR